MKSFVLLLPLLVLVRAAEDAETCNKVKAEFNQCTRTAHETYKAAVVKGDDGRPDFMARKSCNYLDEAIEKCGNQLREHDCSSEAEVTAMKDSQIKTILTQLKSSVKAWDSCKCPAVKAHIDRVKKAEGVETDEKECPAAEPEEKPEAGGAMAMVTNNTTFLTIATTILAIFQLSHL